MAKKISEKSIKSIVIFLALLVLIGIIAIAVFCIIFVNDITEDTDTPYTNNVNNISNNITNENNIDYNYPEFDESKIVKTTENIDKETSYNIKDYDEQGIFSAIIDESKVYIKLEDINNNFNILYPSSNLKKDQSYEIKNITEKVIDINFGYLGENYSKLVLLLLCENGDIKYVDLSTSNVLNENLVANDNIIANNIVRIENVVTVDNNKETNTIIVISNDGMSYNVQDLI